MHSQKKKKTADLESGDRFPNTVHYKPNLFSSKR